MKNYTITVNGTIFDVTVEEAGASTVARVSAPVPVAVPTGTLPTAEPERETAAPAAPKAPAPASAPAQAASVPQEKTVPEAVASGAGKVNILAGAAGKVFKIEASVGQSVQPGDAVVILEAMKMEIPIVAPQAGTVASIDVGVGDAVEAGEVLATMN